ncbi:hypothetical protein [Cellulomonas sp. HZM]|uniref:hypothetical protein n=1 Tax=Cellulomonas sp. HZM TaxID=1454010 RepID=UPI00049395F6|nr:hypothetical protein [Cellulomonas sp. HZM]
MLVGAGLVLVVALLVAAWFWHNLQMRSLLRDVRATELVMVTERDAVADAIAPLNATTGGPTDQQRADARQAIVAASERGLADLIAATGPLEDASIAPWDRSLALARDRYLDHVAAWNRMFKDEAREYRKDNPAALSGATITGTFLYAGQRMRAALGPAPLFGNASEVDEIFTE